MLNTRVKNTFFLYKLIKVGSNSIKFMKELNSNSGKFLFSKSLTTKFTHTKCGEEGCCKFETASNMSNVSAIFYHMSYSYGTNGGAFIKLKTHLILKKMPCMMREREKEKPWQVTLMRLPSPILVT